MAIFVVFLLAAYGCRVVDLEHNRCVNNRHLYLVNV